MTANPHKDIPQNKTGGKTQREALATLTEQVARRKNEHAAVATRQDRRLAWLKRRYEDTTDRAQQHHQRQRRMAKRQHKAALLKLDAELDAERAKLDTKAKTQQEQIAVESRDIEIQAVEAYEQERWVAGSVLEGTATKIKQWHKDRQAELTKATRQLETQTRQAQDDLEDFRMPDLALALADDAPPQEPRGPGDSEKNDTDTETDTDTDPSEATYPPSFKPDQPWAWYEDAQQRYQQHNRRLAQSPLPNLFIGVRPWIIASVLILLGSLAGLLLPHQIGGTQVPPPVAMEAGAILTLLLVIPLGWVTFRIARRTAAAAATTSAQTRTEAKAALQTFHDWVKNEYDARAAAARAVRDATLHDADGKYRPIIEEIRQRRRGLFTRLETTLNERTDEMTERFGTQYSRLNQAAQDAGHTRDQRIARRLEVSQQRYDRDLAAQEQSSQTQHQTLESHWATQRDAALATLAATAEQAQRDAPDWLADDWKNWTPPRLPAASATFGRLQFQPDRLLHHASDDEIAALGLPPSLDLPAALCTPGPRSWMIQAHPRDRDRALSAMRSLILRLLTTQPPGRVRLTLLDPIGLGESFAALMHLADHDEQLVNSRVWSEPAQMERRLLDLTDHMSLVIQKYLRNDFQTIEAYNAQAGELAEPYRFLVMADFPHGISDEAMARLSSIAAAGPRCGVFILLLRDPRQKLSPSVLEDLHQHCVTVRRHPHPPATTTNNADLWQINDPVLGGFPLTLEQAPDKARYTSLLQRIGEGAVDAERVQVPFASITPPADDRWTGDSAEELSVFIGRSGATRLQRFTLGRGVEQHALIAGKTGSGKSSLLHALVTNLALWYPPDQLELYLIDFKKGVEFKPYVTHQLPHARAIAIESDRAFGLSILRKLDRLMDQRGEQFREGGVQSLPQFRKAKPDLRMPRVLLVVDEFQELFSRDDQLSQDAAMLLDRLVRQGRAFGVHALLGSQSLSGAAGLARGTMGQMAVRIALQCNESDAQLIMSDENTAARLLNRPGEALYNHRGGDVEGNAVFQVAWLPDEEMAASLKTIHQLRQQHGIAPRPRAIFEGNAPALLSENAELNTMLDQDRAQAPPAQPRAFVGEPIAIESATALHLSRQPGAHALIVGGTGDTALPLIVSATVSLAAQYPADAAGFAVLNGSSEPDHDQTLQQLADALPHTFTLASPRDATAQLLATHDQMKRRLDADDRDAPALFLMIFGLQRFRDLRKQEDNFAFSLDDDDASNTTPPDKALRELLRDGPALGIHLIAWADRAAAADAAFDRRDLREFDSRVLFQMSANDSAQLIDSTEANDLGGFRAILHREDRGTLSRFRPYGPVAPAWLGRVGVALRPS